MPHTHITYISNATAHKCGYPGCTALPRLTLRTCDPTLLTPLDIPSCLAHEKHLTGALKLLGLDAEAVLHPTGASR